MITTRRYYIDRFLYKNYYAMNGQILDIGGTKVNPRGNFRLPITLKKNLNVLNINSNTNPDYLLSIEKKLNINKKFDTIIMNEVIEYIDNLDNVFFNISNLSKSNSVVFISWPWMNTFHGDKELDLKRYSKLYISRKLKNIGFDNISIKNNGGIFSVIWDFVHRLNNENSNIITRKITNIFLLVTFRIVIKLDQIFDTSEYITTGFTLIAKNCK